MFKKLMFMTDLHLGRSLNSPVALKDSSDFIDWAIDEAKKRNCETFIFGGDWHDNRASLSLNTLDVSLKNLVKISKAFEKSYMLIGNHDAFMRASLEINSMCFAEHIPNITIIEKPTTIGDVTFLPWLVENQQNELNIDSRYVFAHLELAGFLMNAKVAMAPGEHVLNAEVFSKNEYVFTGHFHMRQIKNNIVYTGNVMPFNFSDNWDEDRGIMFLEWGGKPEFLSWPKQPLFRTMTLSQMLDTPEKFLKERLTARVTVDIDISYEESQAIKDTFISEYGLRKLELLPQVKNELQDFQKDVSFQSIDQIVTAGLRDVKSTGLNSERLIEIYRSLV